MNGFLVSLSDRGALPGTAPSHEVLALDCVRISWVTNIKRRLDLLNESLCAWGPGTCVCSKFPGVPDARPEPECTVAATSYPVVLDCYLAFRARQTCLPVRTVAPEDVDATI